MEWSEIRSLLREAYDREAPERNHRAKDPWKARERLRFLRRLEAAGASDLLEVGMGTGADARFFQESGLAVTGIDLSPRMVEIASERGVRAIPLDMTELSSAFAPASFDAVWSMNALLHVPKSKWSEVLSGVHSVLREGGLFFLGVYGGVESDGIWSEDHNRPQRYFAFHTDDGLRSRIAPWFDLVEFHTVDYGHKALHFQAATLRRQRARA